MTTHLASEPLAPPSVTAAVVALRRRGMRVTRPRRALLERLYAARGPRSVEQLADGSDLASAYRNLAQLEAAGLVRRAHATGGPRRYTLASGRATGVVACGGCGRETPLPHDALAAIGDALRGATGFTADLTRFPIAGRCPDCVA